MPLRYGLDGGELPSVTEIVQQVRLNEAPVRRRLAQAGPRRLVPSSGGLA